METAFADQRLAQPLQPSPASTAVLVVDMLNDFLEDGGAMVLPPGRVLYEPINRLLEVARSAGATIVWVCDCHPAVDREFEKRKPHCIDGTWGAEIVPALRPQEGEYRVRKRRYSGFFETDLDLRLRERAIKTVIVVGVVTNICVRSTVNDAFFRGYDVVVPSDCVAATGPREQEATLFDIDTHYGIVTDLAAVEAAMVQEAQRRDG